MNEPGDLSQRWHQLARWTVWKVNLGWWVEKTTPLLIAVGVLGFALIFWLRSRGAQIGLEEAGPWLAATLGGVLVLGLFLARLRFIGHQQALVRLESQLRLHNALSVAALGRGTWPAVPQTVADGLRWRWSRLGGPLMASLGCLAAALWIPIAPGSIALPEVEPQAWEQMDQWLEKLNDQQVITPEEKAEQAGKVTELREQPKEKWFSHDSLHASDTLKEQLQREIQKLGQDMQNAERSLNALENYADQLSQAAKDKLLKEFNEAVEGLKGNSLEMDPQLLKELAEMDLKNLKSMSKEQLDQLRKSLKEKAGACEGLGQGQGFLGDGEGDDDKLAEMLGELGTGDGEGEGDQPGKGGISRGPGTAPLTLSNEENRFDTAKREAVSNTDLSRAQLGTQLGIQDGKHEVDKTYGGPAAAGNVGSAGQGGEQVWRDSLTPEEKAVLKRVFQ
jgi:hypothetical protein